MTSHPPGKCCTVGVKHEGTANGEIKNIGDISTYFAYPESRSTQNAVLLFTDVFGHEFINAQLIADQLAVNGYFVVMPDLFNGDAAPLNLEGFDIMKWLQGHGPDVVQPIIDTVFKEMRGPLGCKRIGGVGYCYGGRCVVRNLKEGRLDAGYTAHPSFVQADELMAIQGPLSIAASETDSIFPAEKRRESEDILQKLEVQYQINLYSDVEHGFAVRTDLSDPRKKYAKEQAFLQAVAWFDHHIKGRGGEAKM